MYFERRTPPFLCGWMRFVDFWKEKDYNLSNLGLTLDFSDEIV